MEEIFIKDVMFGKGLVPFRGLTGTFKWRERTGEFTTPAQMETRHLYYTVRMIWNHTVPDKFKLTPYQEYSFSEHYTSRYMADAVKYMLNEIVTRNDISSEWKLGLWYMIKVAKIILNGRNNKNAREQMSELLELRRMLTGQKEECRNLQEFLGG